MDVLYLYGRVLMSRLLFVLVALVISSCSMYEVKTVYIEPDKKEPVIFTYSKLNDAYVVSALAQQLTKSSKYPLVGECSSGDYKIDITGINSRFTDSEIIVSYENGYNNCRTGHKYRSKYEVKYKYEWTYNEGAKNITLYPASHYEIIPGMNDSMFPIKHQFSASDVEVDANKIFQGVDGMIDSYYIVSGEGVYLYDARSFLIDLSRKFVVVNRNEYSPELVFRYNNKSVRIKLSCTAYRGGTLARYKIYFPYTEKPDGGNMLDREGLKYVEGEIRRFFSS